MILARQLSLGKQLLKINIGLRKAVIIGGGQNTSKLIDHMNSINILGYEIIGYFYYKESKNIPNIYHHCGFFF